ncbi:MAG: Rieske (2Fe-2S) protein [Pseudomonadota bacterium]|nr:Rieske (2Fe-2S) protein [Pseudomonadota bacterium]
MSGKERPRDFPLCRVGDLPDGAARGFDFPPGVPGPGAILLNRQGRVLAYANRCPHKGTPLETFPDRFLDHSGEVLICSTHGARFRAGDGHCFEGPCAGGRLKPLWVRVVEGNVLVAPWRPVRRGGP